MYLLDTNVISEIRKIKSGKASHSVTTWVDAQPRDTLFISAITLMELEMGVLKIERKDADQGALLRKWLDNKVIPEFKDRTLSIDANVALACAKLHVPDPRSERDALIAATAKVHNLSVATRNKADFEPTGIPVLCPWQ